MKRFPYVYLLIVFSCCVYRSEAATGDQTAVSGEPSASVLEKAAAIEMKMLVNKAQESGTVPVIVEMVEELTPDDKAKLIQKQGKKGNAIVFQQKALMKDVPIKNTKSLKYFDGLPFMAMTVSEQELINLRKSPRVNDIHLDRVETPHADLTTLNKGIGIDISHNSGFTGKGQSVAIIDTGVDRNHPYLRGKVVRELCVSSRIEDKASGVQVVTPLCRGGKTSASGRGAANVDCIVGDVTCAHGTYVAVLAAGNSGLPNFEGSGVAPEAKVIAIKAISTFTTDEDCAPEQPPCIRFFSSDILKALNYVLKLPRRLRVAAVNMSLGGPGECFRDPRRKAITLLKRAKIATIISSGNDGTPYTISTPACVPNAISVGSTNSDTHAISEFSNGARSLDLLAPGEGITVPNFRIDPTQELAIDGTSFSAPIVAGAWASLKSHKPNASVDEILSVLKRTGVGILDVRNATIKPEIRVDAAHKALVP